MKEYLRDIVKCNRCGRCRTVCPTQKVLCWESSGPRGRMLMALGLSLDLKPSSRMVTGLLTCTTCAQCAGECPSGADPMKITRAAREELTGMGHIASHQTEMQDRINMTGNSLGEKVSRTSWLNEPVIPVRSDYVYFAGCLASYRQKATALAAYDLLKPFGVGLLKDERCCGSPLYRLGLDTSVLIEHNSRQIKESGAHTVITECAGCYAMFMEKYKINVIHLSEFISERLDRFPLQRLDITVTYHDPCHLGRLHGIYDAPRAVIEHICTLIEMKDTKEHSSCCGGGGGVKLGYPEMSLSITKELSKNIPPGVDYVLTACPLCIKNLSDIGVKVIDMVDLVRLSLD
jgi:fumarate reductase (CoM/CoB) subunit B